MTLRHLLVEYLERYEQASKTGKSEIAYEIVAIVHGRRGRFLKPNDDDKEDGTTSGHWLEVDDQTARQKVAYSFRYFRRKQQSRIGRASK